MPGAVRVASHVAVWTGVLTPMVAELSRGWRPFGDDAAIASRAYQALSLHPPLTGLATAASVGTGHALYDPGPLLFYLLAAPVHLDPAHGLFWGAALCCGVVLSLAIEAAWSLGAWPLCAGVALGVLDLVWLTPAVFENLPWNAYFPLPFLTAALVLAWVVMMGKTGWWPVLVVAASVSAESHLLFVIPALALVVVAGAFGLVTARPRRYGWLVVGLVLGLVCWLAPLIQELGARPNLTALVRSGRGQSTLGIGFGLRMVGLAGGPRPIWLTHIPTGFYRLAVFEFGHDPWYGGLILGLLAVVTVVGCITGRRALGAFGAVAATSCAALAVSFGVLPAKNFINVQYLIDCLWVVGIVVWAVVGWAAIELVRVVLRRAAGVTWPHATPALGRLAGMATVAALIVVGVLGVRPAATKPGEIAWNSTDLALVERAATAVEHLERSGPVAIEVGPPVKSDYYLVTGWTAGVVFRLEADGWRPGVGGPAGYYTGLSTPSGDHWPTVLMALSGPREVSVVKVP